jgi:hypothetical protein
LGIFIVSRKEVHEVADDDLLFQRDGLDVDLGVEDVDATFPLGLPNPEMPSISFPSSHR